MGNEIANLEKSGRGAFVTAVILLYNSRNHVMNCIESFRNLDYKNFQIIVVDNYSVDGSLDVVRQKYPSIRTIKNEKNLGYAAGNNIGIMEALKDKKTKYVYITNPDILQERGTLGKLVRRAEQEKDCGIIGPVIYESASGGVEFAGATIDNATGKITFLHQKPKKALESLYAMGCAMLVNRKVFEKIGLFDPDYFCYWEETDFCMRAKKAGFRVLVTPETTIIHKGIEEKEKDLWHNLEKNYFLSKNYFRFVKNNIEKRRHKEFILAFLTTTFLKKIKAGALKADFATILGTLAGTTKGAIEFCLH
ncbi:MAG: glycosyltransferase family 2 protein [Candidatus Diapherotrites archaeon]|nr:glycosyltransferase family 2 protein [Candidatus Diapherotrites archaeon]